MNLLFFTTYKISPTKGGTEHTTLSVAQELHNRYGCKCFAVHTIDANTPDCDCFEKQFFVDRLNLKRKLKAILIDNNIDVALSEGGFYFTECIDEIREKEKLRIRNIFVHHFSPGWEVNFENRMNYLQDARSSIGKRKVKSFIKLTLYPFLKYYRLKKIPRDYARAYHAADYVVLLSKGYIPLFQRYGGFNDSRKFRIIPNALSLPGILDKKDYGKEKKHIALVISRLEEPQKRISLILMIWEQVSKDKRTGSWKLLIGGDGIYRGRYEEYVRQHNIKNIEFLGKVKPVPYYKEASIFMMTSKSEGFPLTLNEAMQYGVVPLAFDSFASVHDIVNDGENGFLIPEMDLTQYSNKMLELMSDDNLRHTMAMNAIDSCQRFSPEKIGKMWWDLLNNPND